MLVENNVALQPFNSFGIAARAQRFARVRSETDLTGLMSGPDWAAPVFVLGGGSNLVITGDIKALVLKVDILGRRLVEETAKGWLVEAGGGEGWHDFVRWTLEQGWPGLENMALIPGTVGASPVQNIGAYGVEVGEYIQSIEAYDCHSKTLVNLPASDCALGERCSRHLAEARVKFYAVFSLFVPHLSSVSLQLGQALLCLEQELLCLEQKLSALGPLSEGRQ